ncbi:MAG: ATPase, T2SS/T4P/T4SS family [bacterium]
MGIFTKRSKEEEIQSLEKALAYKDRLLNITHQIHSAHNLDEIFLRLQKPILELFEADRITIYAVDDEKGELFSRFKVGEEIGEIRIPISPASIAGFAAYSKEPITIKDAYDAAELERINPQLHFNQSYDQKSGYRTRQVLASPIMFQGTLQGVIQLINKKDSQQFAAKDIDSVREIAKIIGIAFHNQALRQKKMPSKFQMLVQQNILSEKELQEAIRRSRESNKAIEQILMREYKVAKKNILDSLSDFYQCPFIEFDPEYKIDEGILGRLSPNYLNKHFWMPLRKSGETIEVLVDDPRDIQKIDEIKLTLNQQKITLIGALREDIVKFINAVSNPVDKTVLKVDELLSELDLEQVAEEQVDEEVDDALNESDNTIIKLTNQLIREAYNRGASDIHIEPYPGKQPTIVRYRIDGDCRKYLEIPASYRRAIVARLKIMSQLNIAERRLPQSGKIKFRHNQREIELRVEVTPTVGDQEDVVLRVLASSEPIPLDRLNLAPYNLKNLKHIISQPYGLVLVVGPTGSGKTTTLHSALAHINTPEKKIWTAEDPVEITQYGLRQVQVRSQIGLTFASAMRSFLRADPDVVMVGEMRDKETAAIGIEASLTGHLVFSTLHTNSAPETVVRLLDMGMDPYNFANALLGVLAQRLVKTLCKSCKTAYHPTPEEFQELRAEYGEDAFDRNGFRYTDDLQLYRPQGCQECGQTGYRGRTGIHELLMGSDTVRHLIIQRSTIEAIRDAGLNQGMTTLKQDGIAKVLLGITDLNQVRKVCIK